jgi:hypothetical protein
MARRRENMEQDVIRGCLATLNALDCCEVELAQLEATEPYDGRLRLRGPGGQFDYIVEVKRGLTLPTMPVFLHKLNLLRSEGHPPLLFTDYVHEALAEYLKENSVEFVDLAGNVHLQRPSLYIFVSGRKRPQTPERPTRAFQATGVKLVFLVLKQPAALSWNYRELAEASGIALGSVAWILSDLRALGFVRLVEKGQRELANWHDLLERWEMGYAERLRPKLFRNRCRMAGERSLDELIHDIQGTAGAEKIMVGGELGAALITGDLRPQSVTLHLLGEPQKIMTQLRLVPDPDGPVDVLDAFGRFNQWEGRTLKGLTIADPLLMRAELLLQHSERLRTIAEELRTSYIAGRIEQGD